MLNVAGHCDRRGNRLQSLTSVIKCSGPEVMLLSVHWSKLVSALPNHTWKPETRTCIWKMAELLILLLYSSSLFITLDHTVLSFPPIFLPTSVPLFMGFLCCTECSAWMSLSNLSNALMKKMNGEA